MKIERCIKDVLQKIGEKFIFKTNYFEDKFFKYFEGLKIIWKNYVNGEKIFSRLRKFSGGIKMLEALTFISFISEIYFRV